MIREGKVVVNPYKSSDSRARVADPYCSNSYPKGGHRSCLVGWFSTKNMIVILMACIMVVSYIFHAHQSIAIDSSNGADSSQMKTQLRGTTQLPAKRYTFSQLTFSPSARLSFIPQASFPTVHPITAPTTALPTQSLSVSEVVKTTAVQLPQSEKFSKKIVEDANDKFPGNKNGIHLAQIGEKGRSSLGQEDRKTVSLTELKLQRNSKSRSAYRGMSESMKSRSSLHGDFSKSNSEISKERRGTTGKELFRTEEQSHFYPPHRIPDRPLAGENLPVYPQQDKFSGGMIPFDFGLLGEKGRKNNGSAENMSATDLTANSNLLQATTDRMKSNLQSNVLSNVTKVNTSEASGQISKEKVDHCKAQVDPFQSQPVEAFIPPVGAPFAKALEWQSEVKNALKNVGKMRVGGDKLRQHLQDEVNRLRVKRFNLFCEYVE